MSAAASVVIQPVEVNWVFVWGDTWPLKWQLGTENASGTFVPTDLSGASAKVQIRNSAGTLLRELIPIVTAASGLIDATQSWTATQVEWSPGYYELEITYGDGTKTTEAFGEIQIQKGRVTQ